MKLLFYDMQMPDLLKDNGKSTGGACVRVFAISKGLISLGHQVGILTWRGANQYVGEKIEGLDLVETHPTKGGIRYFRLFYFYFYLMFTAIQNYKPDYLFIKGCELKNGILAFITSLLNIPLVYLATNDKDADDRYKRSVDGITQKFFKYSLGKSKLIVCQNEYQYNKLRDKYPEKKFLIMHNPYYYKSALPPIKERSKRHYIAWVGLFSTQKNLPLLLRIVTSMPEVQFKIAGSFSSGSMARSKKPADLETTQAIGHLKMCANVEFKGFLNREDTLAFLSEAYALVNTSHYEGFSNTYLEALAAGTPVITQAKTDPDGILEKNNLGVVVGNENEYLQAIKHTIEKTTFDKDARFYREYLLKNHGVTIIANKIITSLHDLKAKPI